MKVQLSEKEEVLRREIANRVSKAKDAFDKGRLSDDLQKWILEAGKQAHNLHIMLKKRGLEPKHHNYMIKNRELQPSDSEFYNHFHPLEDLLKFLADTDANNDPIDQTMDVDFEFRVFSRRWGHDDTYKIKRTKNGWHISHIAISGPCDKEGKPFLFRNLDQDSISYPAHLGGYMEMLWENATELGLSKESVQENIQKLADWVSLTERNAPSGGIWANF